MRTYFKSFIFTAFLIVIFIVSFAIGYTFTINSKQIKTRDELKGKNITEIANIANKSTLQKINNDTVLVLRKYFKKCGHIVEEQSYFDPEYIGLYKTDIQKIYRGWTLEHYSPNYVILSRVFDGLCPNHFIISIKDDRVAIFYSQPRDGETLKLITPIDIKNLSNKQIEDLKNGIVVDTYEQAIKIIEDFGS
ncbi:BofC C-terminal domain-containing protein [Caldicellulosiruptoraceae bacterium PP1]